MKVAAALLIAAVLMPVVAGAQEWRLYNYRDPDFSIQFPAAPAMQTGTVKNTTGVSLPMTRYVVRQDGILYSVSIVNYSSTNDDALTTIIATQRSLGTSGKVSAVSGARVNRNFGRELSIIGNDGSRSAVAIFFVDRHLYTVVAQVLPPKVDDRSGDAIRFQRSLQFPDDNGGFFSFFTSSAAERPPVETVAEPVRVPAKEPLKELPKEAPKEIRKPRTDAACAGRSAGDTVQLETSAGRVAATCTLTLIAQPNSPADSAH